MIKRWLIRIGKLLARDDFHSLERRANMSEKKAEQFHGELADLRNMYSILYSASSDKAGEPWHASRLAAIRQVHAIEIGRLKNQIEDLRNHNG